MPKVVVKKGRKTRVRRAAAAKNKQVTLLGHALRSLGGLGGSALGGYFGAPATGGAVGTSLGAAISKWLGSGDYVVTNNSLTKVGPTIPAMHNQSQSIVVRHKEYLGPVKGSIDFTVQHEYVLNPGMVDTFPWLARIAGCFQEYTFRGAVFHYVPTSGMAITNSNPAIGSVMMQTSYRSTEDKPQTKIELLNEYWASESAPNETFAHPLECQPAENPFKVQYIRSAPLETDSPLMYDLGKTFIATQGMPATGNPIGDLWITYEVELRKPIVKSNVAPGLNFSTYGVTLPTQTSTTHFFSNMYWQDFTGMSSQDNTITAKWLMMGTYSYQISFSLSSGNFTAMDLSGPLSGTGFTEVEYKRTVLAGTSPQLNRGIRYGKIRVDQAGMVTMVVPNFTFTPATAYNVEVNIEADSVIPT